MLAGALRDLVEKRFRTDPTSPTVEVVGGPWDERVRRVRDEHGSVPIGCAPPTEQDCLGALRAGADEALVVPNADPVAMHSFIDRTLLRASLRREHERLSASIGHSEKLTALGTLVAGVAHEINNPLTVVRLSVDQLQVAFEPFIDAIGSIGVLAELGRPLQPEELTRIVRGVGSIGRRHVRGYLADADEAVSTITSVVRDLRIFARAGDDEESSVVDIKGSLERVLRIIDREISERAILERDFDADLPPVFAPPTRLTQVFTNVLINAAHAIQEIERPVHRVRVTTRADDEIVAVTVSDTGPGIAPEDLERIFDPFYTTKRQDLGTGLGLSISRSLLRQVGGDLLVESVYGTGAQFLIYLPRATEAQRQAAGTPRRASIAPAGATRLTVLVVDDDERMLRAYGRTLASSHDVVVAADADEAIQLLSSGTRPDVLVSEVFLPGMQGPELYGWIEAERPELAAHTLFVTARTTDDEVARRLRDRGLLVLHKPIDRSTLMNQVAKAALRPSTARPTPR